MTLIFDDQSTDLGTHALLIGVGDYPYLKGGSAPAQLFVHHMEMGQLSSPPISVQEMASWLSDPVSGMLNTARPLRSLEVLGSSSTTPQMLVLPGRPDTPLQRASMVNVEEAVATWMERAGRNTGNTLLFFFCGHGISYSLGESSLLLDDFGSNPLMPMAHAIDFDTFRFGLIRRCAAENQVFFLDACRTEMATAFERQFGDANKGIPIVTGGGGLSAIRNKAVPVFFATGLGSLAYGQPGEPTIFTQGLLRAFRGSASREASNNGWEVVATAITEGVNKCVESLAFQKIPQYCDSKDANRPLLLHRLRGKPEVVVKVTTSEEQLNDTLFSCESKPPPPLFTDKRIPPGKAPWWIHLPAGQYTFTAVSHRSSLLIGSCEKHVAPPASEVTL
ncbi:caspase family protein [Lysobacter arenosi]|uniref:Caspase family protein n=1 Tax=Lysobacter arenosi TaxID=2795387 RepID=A0ABX7RAJ4_9GAMM|nr:caspase family protein [Lysobacter arenosi]QSX74009.1 caspase family protein [Lysobacter arenosi]